MKYFTPGPTHLAPSVADAIGAALRDGICSISHRSKIFESLFARATGAVRALLEVPESHSIVFLGSATEAFERIIQSAAREHTFHFVNGAFSERFFLTAKELGRRAQSVEAEPGRGFHIESVSIPAEAELVCLTHNETSTGVSQPLAALEALRRASPQKLIALDIVSSAPIVRVPWGAVDAAFFSVQKCFGLPAGLGVLIVNQAMADRAARLRDAGLSVGSYHSLESLLSFAKKNQTPETPNVLGIYLLAVIGEEMVAKGITTIRQEIRERAQALYAFLEASDRFSVFVADPAFRSETVLTVEARDGAAVVAKRLAERHIELGAGYAQFKDRHLRIANFPALTSGDVDELLEALKLS